MDRDLLNDEQWQRIAPLVPGKDGDPGRSGKDNRLFVEAVLWLVRAGCAVARSAAAVRQVENGVEALPTMGRKGRFRADI